MEQSIEWQSSLYINFIDFEKAFDSISREVLSRLLQHYGMPVKVVTVIRALYEGFSAQVVHNGQRTQPLKMRTGVRQGWLLSPLLFLVALDWVTRTAFDRREVFSGPLRHPWKTLTLPMIWPYCRTNTGYEGQDTGLGGTRCKGRPEDQCHQDKADVYWYQT